MSAESAAALEIAVADWRVDGDGEALKLAAQAHEFESRQLETVLGEYRAVVEAMAAGEPYDPEELDALGTELTFARQARAYAEGSLPVTTTPPGIGD